MGTLGWEDGLDVREVHVEDMLGVVGVLDVLGSPFVRPKKVDAVLCSPLQSCASGGLAKLSCA